MKQFHTAIVALGVALLMGTPVRSTQKGRAGAMQLVCLGLLSTASIVGKWRRLRDYGTPVQLQFCVM
jgi:hypothetical protein